MVFSIDSDVSERLVIFDNDGSVKFERPVPLGVVEVNVRTEGQQRGFGFVQTQLKLRKAKRRAIGGSFTNGQMEMMRKLAEQNGMNFCGYVLSLLPFVKYEDGKLGNNPRDFNVIEDLQNIFKIKSRMAKIIAKDLIDSGVISRDENGFFYMNRKYHNKGTPYMSDNVKFYDSEIRGILDSGIKPKDAAALYFLAPYLSYATNLIVANPKEVSNERLEPLSLSDISKVLGMKNTHEVKKKLSKMIFIASDGKPMFAFGFSEVGGKKSIFINPLLIRRISIYDEEKLFSNDFITLFQIHRPIENGGRKLVISD